jgi:hypothetical protein
MGLPTSNSVITTPLACTRDPAEVIDDRADDPHSSVEKAEDWVTDAVAAEAGEGGGAAASRS